MNNVSGKSFKTLRKRNWWFGVIYLMMQYDAASIFVYDSNYNKLTFTYNETSNSISSESFLDETQYLISFSSELVGTRYSLNQPCDISYYNLEIQGVGNIDKITKKYCNAFWKS